MPFVFLTGYERSILPADLADIDYVQKPMPSQTIVGTIERRLSGGIEGG